MERWERERILGEWGVRDGTARSQIEGRKLEQELADAGLRGRPLRQRLRNFRPDAAAYVASLGGPLPYMERLRTIHEETADHERRLEQAWLALAEECSEDQAAFAERWQLTAGRWTFYVVNDLIERHNRYFPAESRLPMDPRTGDFALIGGRSYRRRPLDVQWVLERFPPELPVAARAA